MAAVLSVLVGLAALAFILWPFWRRSRPPMAASPRDTAADEEVRRLEFDLDSGIISPEEYRELMSGKRPPAARPGRARPAADVDEEIERQVRALRKKRARTCPRCGARAGRTDRFCPACGAKLGGEG